MNPFELIKNTAALKEQTEKMQKELEMLTAEGSSGGRMVVVKMNGKFEMTDIKLDPLCVDNRDIKMLEDLIVAAQHDAVLKLQDMLKEKTGSMLQGLNLSDLGL
ncbi:MAG: YbaB/EbfC family nucleoid-associated protein [Treponema sp.]